MSTTTTPPGILLLADHLDAVLAAGEDLIKLEVNIEGVRRSIPARLLRNISAALA